MQGDAANLDHPPYRQRRAPLFAVKGAKLHLKATPVNLVG